MAFEYPPKVPRVYVDADLAPGVDVTLDAKLLHYLATVMRVAPGEQVTAFNGRHGEWLCRLLQPTRKTGILKAESQTKPQPKTGDIWFAFAPIKSERLDYLVQKAVEMGVSDAFPVFTERTQGRHFNAGKARANMVEAAEQCGILAVPALHDAVGFDGFLSALPTGRTLIFCDEDAEHRNPLDAVAAIGRSMPIAIIIGPVGGFSEPERQQLMARPGTVRISLGPRILRADTAAVAALAVIQAAIGDW
jgi:16S rRNA (uracil1498-N3)-methyltransferase